jgi:general secretion pathway protein J
VAGGKRHNGFTLIEMLIAMTLLGIMVVLLFSSLKIAAESWDAGENKIVEVNRKAVVYQFFKRHLTTIRPLPIQQTSQQSGSENLETDEQAFLGQSRAIRFVAGLPASSARKGLQVFEIYADSAEPSTIMVALSPYLQAEPGEPDREVLLQNVKTFAFAYFGKKEDDGEAVWLDDWTGTDRLPQLIKVGIRLEDGSYWPDMVFPLKINGQATVDNIAADNNQTAVP